MLITVEYEKEIDKRQLGFEPFPKSFRQDINENTTPKNYNQLLEEWKVNEIAYLQKDDDKKDIRVDVDKIIYSHTVSTWTEESEIIDINTLGELVEIMKKHELSTLYYDDEDNTLILGL